ncbi:MAG: hypothetical protein ACLS5R_07725 [Blautia sp.]
MEADLTYELRGGIRLLEPPIDLQRWEWMERSTGREQDWTAISALDVKKEPGSEETAYTVQPEETVKLLETTCQDGKIWILCENSSKEQGWLEDPEEYLYDENTGCSGCFKEAVFAG